MEELKRLQEGQEHLTRLQEAHSGLQQIETIARAAIANHEPINASTVELIRSVADKQVVGLPQELQIRSISTESCSTPMESLLLSLEGISETASKVWEAIKAAAKKLADWLSSLFTKLTGLGEKAEEKANQVTAFLEEKREMWSAEPPAADKPQYPYGSLSNEQVMPALIDGKIPADWFKAIPKSYQTFFQWIVPSIEEVNTSQKKLLELWTSTLKQPNRTWDAFDAAAVEAVRRYNTLYGTAPKLPGGVSFRLANSDKGINTLADILQRGQPYVGLDSEMNYSTQKLSQSMRLVTHGNLTEAVSSIASLAASNETHQDTIAQELNRRSKELEHHLAYAMDTRTHSDENWDSSKSIERFGLVSGKETKTLVSLWWHILNALNKFITLILTLAKMHTA